MLLFNGSFFVLVHGVENQRKSYSNIGDLSCTGMWRCSRYSIDSLMYIIALKFALQIKIEMGVRLPFPEYNTYSGLISVGSHILCICRPLCWVNRLNGMNGHVFEPRELDINSFTHMAQSRPHLLPPTLANTVLEVHSFLHMSEALKICGIFPERHHQPCRKQTLPMFHLITTE